MYFCLFLPLPPENRTSVVRTAAWKINDAKASSPSPLTTAPPLRRPVSSAKGGVWRETEFYCLKVGL